VSLIPTSSFQACGQRLVAEAVLGHSIMALNLWRVVLRKGMRLIGNHLTLKLSHNWPVVKELLAGLKESRQLIDRSLCRTDSYRYPRKLVLLRLVKKMFVAAFLFSRTPCPFPYPTSTYFGSPE
jgi:hypothetical protein